MSAELLREAAALMRSRAEDATLATGEGPWSVKGTGWNDVMGATWTVDRQRQTGVCEAHCEEQAEHIASWHPAVALAVADWLDAVAEVHWPKRSDMHTESHYNAEPEHDYFNGLCDESCWRESHICNGCGTRSCKPEISGSALNVARAYLGHDS